MSRSAAALAAAAIVLAGLVSPVAAGELPAPTPLPSEEPAQQATGPAGPAADADPADTGDEPDSEPTDDDAADEDAAAPDEPDAADPTAPPEPGEPTDHEPADGEPTGDQLTAVVLPEVSHLDEEPGYLLPAGDGGFRWLVNGTPVDELVTAGAARVVPDDGGTGERYEVTAAALGMDIGAVVIAAVAVEGFVLTGPDGDASGAVVDLRTPVEPVEPTALDLEGQTEDAILVPDVPGLAVHDGGDQPLMPGEHPVMSEYVDGQATVELSLTAAPGYRLEIDGTPVETVPGAGGTWPVVLNFTDVEPPAEEDEPGEEAGPADPAEERSEPAAGTGTGEGLISGLVTVGGDVGPEPGDAGSDDRGGAVQPDAPAGAAPEPAPESDLSPETERLSDSGPEGLGLLVLLSVVFLGGAWLVMGTGGDLFS